MGITMKAKTITAAVVVLITIIATTIMAQPRTQESIQQGYEQDGFVFGEKEGLRIRVNLPKDSRIRTQYILRMVRNVAGESGRVLETTTLKTNSKVAIVRKFMGTAELVTYCMVKSEKVLVCNNGLKRDAISVEEMINMQHT